MRNHDKSLLDVIIGNIMPVLIAAAVWGQFAMPGWAASLPAGYAELKYVESSGSQYVDTGIVPKSTTRVVCRLQFTQDGKYRMGWGAGSSGEAVLWGVSDSKFRAYFSASFGYKDSIAYDTDIHVFDLKNGSQKLDDVEFGTMNTLGNTATESQTMYLFAGHVEWGSSGIDYKCYARIYSCEFYEGETQVRGFVPALRVSDVTAGLYDTVSGEFFAPGGGALT